MTPNETALDLAAKRLERAIAVLEQRLTERVKAASAAAGGLFDQDRSNLADELDRSRAREKELEAAGAEASAALARAISEIRALVGEKETQNDAARGGQAQTVDMAEGDS